MPIGVLNNKLGRCSIEQVGNDFYIVGADSVRKKLGSRDLVLTFTGNGFAWGTTMYLDISEYKRLVVSGRMTDTNADGNFLFQADGVTLAQYKAASQAINFSKDISIYKQMLVAIGVCHFAGTITFSV